MFQSAWNQMEIEILRNKKGVPFEMETVRKWAFAQAKDLLVMVLSKNLAQPLDMKLKKRELVELQDAVKPSVLQWEEGWKNPTIEDRTIIGKNVGIPDEYIAVETTVDSGGAMDSDSDSVDSDD